MSRRLSVVILAAWAAWYLWLAVGLPLPGVVNGLLDDSFYYLQVARNVARGLGSTFDLVEPTNGYHPLWMLCLVPCMWITGGHPEWAVRAGLLVSALLGLGALLLTRSLLRRERGEWAAAAALLLFAWPRFFGLTVNLLESTLELLLLLLLVRDALQPDRGGRTSGRAAMTGLLLGALCLARLDAVFLVAAWGLIELGRRAWKRIVVAGATCALLVAPYLAWNLATFGHLLPVSGAVKSTFPQPHLHLEYLREFKEFTLLAAVGVGFFAASLRRGASPWVRALGWLGLGGALHFAWTMVFMGWGVDRWHFVHLVPLALLGLPWLADRALDRWGGPAGSGGADGARTARLASFLRGGMIVLAVLAAVALQAYSLARRGERHLDAARRSAEWARDQLPADAVYAMTDAGVFAWFSGREVINLDGLINNYRYQEALRDARLDSYLRERGVGFFFDQYAYGQADLIAGRYAERRIRIWYFPERKVAGEFVLRREDEVARWEVRSSPYAMAPAEENVLVLWRYRP